MKAIITIDVDTITRGMIAAADALSDFAVAANELYDAMVECGIPILETVSMGDTINDGQRRQCRTR